MSDFTCDTVDGLIDSLFACLSYYEDGGEIYLRQAGAGFSGPAAPLRGCCGTSDASGCRSGCSGPLGVKDAVSLGCLSLGCWSLNEWINEIPTVPIYYLAKPQPRERAWNNQRGKKTLLSLTLV